MSKKLYAIGEALIDFIPMESGRTLKQVSGFRPAVGGAPANVCGAFSKLGGASAMITQLGKDPFGDKIVEEFEKNNIDCSHISRTQRANTSLAFVALKEDGNREFSFYRKPGADMLMDEKQIKKSWFEDAFALHFCSVSIGDFPMRNAHEAAINYALECGALISFDPNLRYALWKDERDLKKAVLEFLPKAHIIKISDEELEFITGKNNIEAALPQLFVGNVKMVIYTAGANGAYGYVREGKINSHAPGYRVKAYDTTGAGDGFIGSFLFQLYEANINTQNIEAITAKQLEKFLDFSNKFCAISVMKPGAIDSYPSLEQMKN